MLVTSAEMVTRAMNTDLAYTMQRMRVIEEREGNPLGIAIRHFGAATALAAAKLPSARFNRVVGLSPTDVDKLPEILKWYADLGLAPRVEIRPGNLDYTLADGLTRAGFRQTRFHASLVGSAMKTPAPHLDISSVETPEAMEQFLDVYLAGWGVPHAVHDGAKANMRGWLGLPDWHLYLARVEGQPAATAILFLHEKAAYFADTCVHPDFRGRHLQSALLAHYKTDAVRYGADLLCGQAAFGSTSHRNMERAELRLLHTQAEWTKGKAGAFPDEPAGGG
ncbi:MAG: hypothetical protein ABS76_25125 [Pelagibacterium sp. SCN 64-44]|nr:MAG: hypothetical protein ABS76_25125 [Pelagibacterium sp. SCN 64-44]